jgi:hypothetical protein
MTTKSLPPPEKQPVDIHPTSTLAVFRKHIPPPPLYSHHGTRKPNLNVDTSKLLGTTNTSTVGSNCMATMQLVYLVRTEMTTHHHSAIIPAASSCTELQKCGKIQSHHDRALGMNFRALHCKVDTIEGCHLELGRPKDLESCGLKTETCTLENLSTEPCMGKAFSLLVFNDSNNYSKLLPLRGFFHQNKFRGWKEEQRSSCSKDAPKVQAPDTNYCSYHRVDTQSLSTVRVSPTVVQYNMCSRSYRLPLTYQLIN